MCANASPPYQVTVVEDVLKNHGHTDLKSGLSTARRNEVRFIYGSNELEKEDRTPLWKLVLEQFDDKLVQILLHLDCSYVGGHHCWLSKATRHIIMREELNGDAIHPAAWRCVRLLLIQWEPILQRHE